MNHTTYHALQASIAKWEANVSAATPQDVTLGSNNCPLCVLFIGNDCTGCPANITDEGYCHGTPYGDVVDARFYWEQAIKHLAFNHQAFREQDYRDTAKRELNFLRSLLPKDHQ